MTTSEQYAELDGLALAAVVREREASPLELVECAIARIEATNPALNAVVHTFYDRARAAADGAVADGPFAGVPILLKDLIAAYAGEPLTYSCRFLADHVPTRDSTLVTRYKRAGAIILGQTNTPEYGLYPVTESVFRGPARNPWNPAHTPGGSSGGSAAAVAAGMVPIAHGGDGGGSIRIPASCCGLFGLKPSRGRTPIGPDIGDSLAGFVQDHVLTRSVRDSAAMLDATAGADPGAPYAAPPQERPFQAEVDAEPVRLKIAFTGQSLLGNTTHPDCAAALADAVELCRSLGHDVVEARPEFDKQRMIRAYLSVVACETAGAIETAGRLMGRPPTPDGFEPQTWMLAAIGRKMSGAVLASAQEDTRLAGRGLAEFLADYDLFLTPTQAYPPVEIGHFDLTRSERWQLAVLRRLPLQSLLDQALEQMSKDGFETTANTMLFNMTGQPAMSVPLYWAAGGLPIGVQFVARFGDEATLFRLAGQLERARPWADRRPALS